MFRKIRRIEKQLTTQECHEVLTEAEYGTLATMGADGYPYAVSVNYVFHNGNIYTNFNSVIIFGKAKEVIDGEKMEGLIAFLKKFLNANEYNKHKEEGIKYIEKSLKRTKLIKIEIEHITGKRGIRNNRQIHGKQH